MTSKHKSEDYKLSTVEYYLVGDKSNILVCEILNVQRCKTNFSNIIYGKIWVNL